MRPLLSTPPHLNIGLLPQVTEQARASHLCCWTQTGRQGLSRRLKAEGKAGLHALTPHLEAAHLHAACQGQPRPCALPREPGSTCAAAWLSCPDTSLAVVNMSRDLQAQAWHVQQQRCQCFSHGFEGSLCFPHLLPLQESEVTFQGSLHVFRYQSTLPSVPHGRRVEVSHPGGHYEPLPHFSKSKRSLSTE